MELTFLFLRRWAGSTVTLVNSARTVKLVVGLRVGADLVLVPLASELRGTDGVLLQPSACATSDMLYCYDAALW